LTTTSSLRRLRQRRHQRGATLVEAAFMFPMLIICFYACVYMHTYYVTQIDDNTLAREYAWNDSMSNCGSGAGQAVDADTPPAPGLPTVTPRSTFVGIGAPQNKMPLPKTVPGPLQPLTGQAHDAQTQVASSLAGGDFPGVIGGLLGPILGKIASVFPDIDGGQATTTSTFNWRAMNEYGGSGVLANRQTGQTITVMCNQQPQNGSPQAVFGDIAKSLVGAVQGIF
jgi:hypothetical protein